MALRGKWVSWARWRDRRGRAEPVSSLTKQPRLGGGDAGTGSGGWENRCRGRVGGRRGWRQGSGRCVEVLSHKIDGFKVLEVVVVWEVKGRRC